MRKELAHLIPNYKMAFYPVKIGFRILTIIFTRTAFYKALFSNFVATEYKTGLNDHVSFKVDSNNEKRACTLNTELQNGFLSR
ncbi:hypothetical protein [Bacillus sp. ISL-45]|uniref:hypothetical protein n=1 Tax=Bacillus sp. ISL-45 TaxID=2819128 RepID=UPI001BEA638B|nr:hypothetical protein [Bacillus sp. ISL-45]